LDPVSVIGQLSHGDWRKVAIAWAICERTTARQDWIAERLHLKSASNVSQRVRQYRLLAPSEKSRAMRAWEKQVKASG